MAAHPGAGVLRWGVVAIDKGNGCWGHTQDWGKGEGAGLGTRVSFLRLDEGGIFG